MYGAFKATLLYLRNPTLIKNVPFLAFASDATVENGLINLYGQLLSSYYFLTYGIPRTLIFPPNAS